MILPEVEKKAFFFLTAVEIDSHAPVILAAQELSESRDMGGRPACARSTVLNLTGRPIRLQSVGSPRPVGQLTGRTDQRVGAYLVHITTIKA